MSELKMKNDYLSPKIAEAARRARYARLRFLATKRRVQRECKHEFVVEAPGYDGVLSYHKPLRLCLQCGYQEEAWSWGPHSRVYDHPVWQKPLSEYTVLNAKFVMEVTRDELYAMRPVG